MIDVVVIVIFFIISLIVGLLSSRGIKDFTQFSVGNRSFSSFIIFATLSASFIGGGYTLGNAAKVYEEGLIYSFALLGFSLKEIVIGLFIAPKMVRYRDCLSIGDIMGKHYGLKAKIATGFLSILLCTGILGAQVGALSTIFNTFFNIHSMWAVWISFIVVIGYSAIGGMRAVVFTDVFQCTILFIGIPLTFFLGLHYVGIDHVIETVPAGFINFLHTGNDYLILITLFITFIVGEALVPPYVQRLFMGRDERQTAVAVVSSGLVSIPFFLIAGSIGLITLTLNPNLNANEALPYLVKHVLPTGVKGFVISGLLAIIISSASGFLNAASVALINDIAKPLVKVYVTEVFWLRLAKLGTLFVGFGAVFFALSIHNVLDILLYAYNFWAPVILVPLVMAILGVKVCGKNFFIGACSGILGTVVWSLILKNPWGVSGVFIGVIINFIGFFISRCIYPGQLVSRP